MADHTNGRIRKIDIYGNVTTLAGNGTQGFADGTGGRAGTAEFSYPEGVAADAAGNVYVADAANNRIRKIDPSGNVNTLAGNGSPGFVDGTGGPTGTAEFQGPRGVAVDRTGNVFVADDGNNSIRKIDPNGNVSTVPNASFPVMYGLAVDGADNIYVADTFNNCIVKVDTNGNITTIAGNGTEGYRDGTGGPSGNAEFNTPTGVSIDNAGDIIVADYRNHRVRKIDQNGAVTTLGGNGTEGYADGTGGPSGTAEFYDPKGVAVDGSGEVFVADDFNCRIRKISP